MRPLVLSILLVLIKLHVLVSYSSKNAFNRQYVISNSNSNSNSKNIIKNFNRNILNSNNNDDNNNKTEYDNSYLFTPDGDLVSTSNKKGYNLDMKRFIGFNVLALLLAFVANFLGVTSLLLSNVNPEYFKMLKFDQIYSINSFLRIVTDDYMFVYPDNWIPDIQALDLKDRNLPILLQQKQKARPSIAFRKPATKLENVSVIKSKILEGFTLTGTLGNVNEAAEKLLSLAAPPPKTYKLINAYDELRNGNLYYIYEYSVQIPGTDFNQHAISIITTRDSNLFTMTAVAPNESWIKEENNIKKIANSFQIINK